MAMRKIEKRKSEETPGVVLDDDFWNELKSMHPEIHFLTYDEAMEALDTSARNYFGIGADEFIRRWDSHDFAEDDYEIASMLSWTIPAKWPK